MFKPVNRHVLVEIPSRQKGDAESLIVLPEDYKPEEGKYLEVVAACSAEDTRFDIPKGSKLIVDRSMIEEITVGATIYNIILDNYVVGMIE